MADFKDQDILECQEDFEYNFGGDDLLGPRDQEEPMEQGYEVMFVSLRRRSQLIQQT